MERLVEFKIFDNCIMGDYWSLRHLNSTTSYQLSYAFGHGAYNVFPVNGSQVLHVEITVKAHLMLDTLH